MNKEYIPAKSRQKNKGGSDEFEVAVFGKASRIGMYVGGVICIVLSLVDRWLLNIGDIALASWMVYMAMQGSSHLVLYKHLKRREMLVSGIICTVFAVVFMVAFAIAVYEHKVGA